MSVKTTVKALVHLARHTDKVWLVPIFLAFVIVALLVAGAMVSPVPVFLYPVI